MVKKIMFFGEVLDCLCSLWLFLSGFKFLYGGQIFEGCALICTGIFWQRAWKAELMERIEKRIERQADE